MKGRRDFRTVDFVVIGVLYVGNVLDVWTGRWVKLTDDVLFGDDGAYFEIAAANGLAVLCVKCLLCLALSLVADMRNRKFAMYFGSLCLWVATPIAAVVASLTGVAFVAMSLPWLAAVLFVTSPLKYSLMFNQRANPSRDQTRLIVALFEFMAGSCAFLLHSCFSNPKDVRVSTLIVVWLALIAPLGIIIILLTVVIRRYCTSDTPEEPTFKKIIGGIRKDVIVKGEDAREISLKKQPLARFIMFAVLLCPAIAVTTVFKAHEKVTRTLTREAELERTWFEFSKALTNLVAIPVISLIVSFGKGTRGTLWDYLVLAFSHVLNTTIMLLIYLYFRNSDVGSHVVIPSPDLSSDPTSVVLTTKLAPGKGKAVVYVYFPGEGTNTYYFKSSLIENPKKVTYVSEEVPVKDGLLQYDFSVWSDGGPRLNQSVLANEWKRYFFVATGSSLGLEDLIHVSDVRDFVPKHAECTIFLSCISDSVIGSSYAKKGTMAVLQQGKVVQSSTIPKTNSSLQWCVPAEKSTFRFQSPISSLSLDLPLQPYREILLVISWEPIAAGKPSLAAYVVTLYRVSDFFKRTVTLLDVTNGLEGVVAAAATVGYVHFFWMEAPLRLRTTIFACTLVANDVAGWLVEWLVEEIREDASLVFLILSACAGLVHVALGAIYDVKLRK